MAGRAEHLRVFPRASRRASRSVAPRKLVPLWGVVAALAACPRAQAPGDGAEPLSAARLERLGFPARLAELLPDGSRTSVEVVEGSGGECADVNAVRFSVGADVAAFTVHAMRRQLADEPVSVWIADLGQGPGARAVVEVVTGAPALGADQRLAEIGRFVSDWETDTGLGVLALAPGEVICEFEELPDDATPFLQALAELDSAYRFRGPDEEQVLAADLAATRRIVLRR